MKDLNKSINIPANISLNDQENQNPFVRVGCTYYKKIRKTDRYGIVRTEYKVWRKEEIILDYGKKYLRSIPHYDDFIM